MASVNKAIILGNCVADAEKRHFADGTPVANLRIATNMVWNDPKTGEKKEEVEYHNVVFKGKLADVAGDYLKKGSAAYVEGRLKTRKYTDKGGVDRYATEIIGERLQLLGGGRKTEDDRATSTATARREKAVSESKAATARDTSFDGDDVPF